MRAPRAQGVDPEIEEARARLIGKPKGLYAFVAVLGAVPACVFGFIAFARGPLVARLELFGAGSAASSFTATGESYSLWATLDGDWRSVGGGKTNRGVMPVVYEVDLVQGGKVIGHVQADTHHRAGYGLKYCSMEPDCEVMLTKLPELPPGLVEVRAKGVPNPAVTHVGDMSLNVRRDRFF